MADVPTKPYLVRAIVQWCNDAGFTPYVAVAVNEAVRVPPGSVKNGEIVLNISPMATHQLMMDNEAISFHARFSGVAREIYVPMNQVIAVYARENGQGMAFEVPQALKSPAQTDASKERAPTHLRPVDALTQNTVARLSEANDAQSSAGPGQTEGPSSEAADTDPTQPSPPASTPGADRPKLKRIK
ncbi:MAG TPA: ClpXP protease specificity-enhancing factor [Burkholderiaceae bacterium]|nr:ClpXP protease specificity-enhancing factor [Burkholderiaceae bacterium]